MVPVAPWAHDRPLRNHNPGDLRPRHAPPPWPGQVDIDAGPGGPFAIFDTPVYGWAALGLWLMYAHDVLNLTTVRAMVGVFAPPSENDTQSYVETVALRVGEGPVDPHDPATRLALCVAIAHYEDAHVLWPQAVMQAGMLLCESEWPDFLAAVLLHSGPSADSTDALNTRELDQLKGQTI